MFRPAPSGLPDVTPHAPWLDGLRLLAALLVLCHHLMPLLPGYTGLPFAYLAVDFFFLISGLVVGNAYRQRLNSDLSAAGFILARLKRLLPILVLAGFCSTAEVFARWRFGTSLADIPTANIQRAIAASFLAMPVPMQPALGHGNWPLNPPLWSLCAEMLVGVVGAAWLLRRTLRWTIGLAGLAATTLVAEAIAQGTIDRGVFVADAPVALARMSWSFAVGLLIQSWVPRPAAPPDDRPRISLIVIGISIMVLAVVMINPRPALVECLLVGVMGPACTAWLWRYSSHLGHKNWRLAGELSYAIYALHWPLLSLLRNGARHLGWLSQDSWISVVWLGLAIILLSLIAVIAFERPVRHQFSRR